MKTFIAFFRGINVGGHNIIPMKDLVNILGSLGCRDVRTYIQSGNVVFSKELTDSKTFSERIAERIEGSFDFKPKVLLLTREELSLRIENNPFPTEEGKNLHFYFLERIPDDPKLDRVRSLKSPTEQFLLRDDVFYLFAPDGIGRSKLAANVESCLGIHATARNHNTVMKVLSMAG